MIALIMSIALEVGVPGTLAIEVVKAENAGFIADYVGITGDLGIMQLNPRYIDYFVERYWDKPGEFCWHNPEHNIYIGLRHLKYLLSIPDFNAWQAIMAYNCGEQAVRGGAPPPSSIDYANAVYIAWRGGNRAMKITIKDGNRE
jgi:soluble lytic murein transglycosylase-like protein